MFKHPITTVKQNEKQRMIEEWLCLFFKGVIIVAAIVFGIIVTAVLFSYNFEFSQDTFDGQTENDSQKALNIAKQFVITSPTFSYDGISDTLEIEIISADNSDSKFLLEGKFKTRHSGYGDRAKLDLSEEITLHTVEVVIVDEKVISAVIDNQWDELNQITCHTASC